MNKTFLQPISELEIKESDLKKEPSLGPSQESSQEPSPKSLVLKNTEDDYILIQKRGNQFYIPCYGSKEDVQEVLKIWNENQLKKVCSNVQASKFILISKKDFTVFFESLEK